MRPVRLRVRGFTAFRSETEVVFEGRRLFVITGPTGAGKSSLLDAMTWALYGRVARSRNNEELVSQGEREMSVLFEFTVRGQGYRVSRRYPGSTTTRLERLVKEQWVPVADKAAEVKREVEAALGMDYATFTRAIVLPQGEFDSFLRGDAKDRRSILSQLIGLGVYQRAGEIARDRAKGHRTQAETIRTQLEKLTLATPEFIAQLRERERQLAVEAAALTARRGALQALADLARAERDRREAASQATATLREIEAERGEALRALAEAERTVEACTKAVDQTTTELAALRYDPGEHDRLKAAVALLDQRAEAERTLGGARDDLAAARKAADDAEAARRDADARAKEATVALQSAEKASRTAEGALAKAAGRAARLIEQVATTVDATEAAATEADTEARRLTDRVRELTSLQQSLTAAAGDRARARDAVTRAERDHATCAQEAKQATEVRTRTEQQATEARSALDLARAEDAAAHLRAGLKVGDPCPVCGEPIAKIEKHRAPSLARAESALAKAEEAQATARAKAEGTAAAMAAAVARLDECRRALDAAEGHHAALVTQTGEYGITADAVPRAIEDTRREADALTATAETRRAEARDKAQLGQALREALARVPSGITPTEVKRAPADANAVRVELAGAVDAYTDAQEGTRAAERTATTAATGAETGRRAAEVAARDVERAERSVVQAERQLASLGAVEGADGNPEAVRKALAVAERQAVRQRELTESLGKQRESLASAHASRTGAATAGEKLDATLARRREELVAADAAATAARTELVTSWRETIGEGEPSMRALKTVMETFEAERDRVQETLTTTRNTVAQAELQLEQCAAMRAEAEQHQAQADLVRAVGTDLQGNRFIAYLLHESMQLLAADASERLSTFTNGRYALVAEEDTFHVMDHLNGDELRSVKTLSGGETFLASLALALSLSEHLPEISGTGGAVSLDSLFLDEGFGALDSEALDLAVQGLETLAEGSRMIGVISHVEELSERLPDRIRVEKGSHGSHVAV